jgi:6-pyruvoyltetrahydropterin/6-carboxytetrahydropterin synthase
MSFYIRLSGDDLTFSAAHFITLENGTCERLHGHTYRVAAEVFGPLNDSGYVVDFVAVRRALKDILADVDHRVLLPTQSPTIHVTGSGPNSRASEEGTAPFMPTAAEIQVTYSTRRWLFPQDDCLLLPIANTTTELLAQHIAQRLAAAFRALSIPSQSRIQIELAEGTGCSAVCDARQ